jgi:5-oxoprolinase (ATP-hydrolysing)
VAAQVAANQQGATQLLSLVERYGYETVAAYMEHLQQAAAHKLRLALSRFSAGRYSFIDHLDEELSAERLTIDFTGAGPVSATNLNANPAITKAAIMYVLRTLIDEDIPLNEGVMAAVDIVLPECLLNPPPHAHGSPIPKCWSAAFLYASWNSRFVAAQAARGFIAAATASSGGSSFSSRSPSRSFPNAADPIHRMACSAAPRAQ